MGNRKKAVRKSARSTRRTKQLDSSFEALLVKKTLCRRPTYTYMLSAADIGKLAPHYKLLLEPDDAFNVIGSKSQLGEVLDAYRDNDRKGVLSLILHVAPLHWATMIVSGREVYFTDSLDYEMLSEYDEALKERPELHLSDYSWEQQNDGHNCGFWALMNAEAIRRQIHDCDPNSGCFPCVLPSVSSGWQVSFFAALRRDMAKRLKANDTDGDGRAVVQEEDEPSNSSSETVPSAKAPAVVQRGRPKIPKKAPTKPPAEKRTKQTETRTAVVSQAESRKRKTEVMDEEAERPEKKQKGEDIEADFEFSDEDGDDGDDGKSGYIQCEVCLKLFLTRRQLSCHKCCHEPRNLECEFCDYKTNLRGNLVTHVNNMHPDPNSRQKCWKCWKTYKHLGTLKTHMKTCSAKRSSTHRAVAMGRHDKCV